MDAAALAMKAKAQLPLIDPMHLAVIAVFAFVLPIFAVKTKFPNPWVLIPLSCAGVYAAMGNETRLPDLIRRLRAAERRLQRLEGQLGIGSPEGARPGADDDAS